MVLYLTEGLLKESVSVDEVIDAINNRRGVLITYHGEDNEHTGARYIEPYVYGLTTANNPAIRAYQYYGDTKKGAPAWKLLRLDRILSWKPTDNTFDIEPQARGWAAEAFNGNDKLLPTIYATVELGEKPMTDLERLRARTRQLKQSQPINIKDINQMNKTSVKGTENRNGGPIGDNSPSVGVNKPQNQISTKQVYQPLNTNGTPKNKEDDAPVRQEPKASGPIVQDKEDEPMTNDQFSGAMKRRLEN